MNSNKSCKFIAFNLFVFFVSVYLLTASGDIVGDSEHGLVRYETTRAIVERFDVSVPAGEGIRGTDGREYSWYGIGQPLLAMPFYIFGKLLGSSPQVSISIMNPLFGAATAVLIYLFCISLGYSGRASLFTSVFYGLGTMAWPLSKQPFDHTVETFFVLFSVYHMYLYTVDNKTSHLLFSSFSFGIAFIIRYVPVLVAPPLFAMIVVHHLRKVALKTAVRPIARDILLFSAAFLPFAGLSLWYNYYRFGSPFETGFSLMAERIGIDLLTGTPLLTGIAGFLISPGKGFFYYSPIALFFFFSIKSFIKKNAVVAASFIFIIMAYPVFFSKNVFWHGDWAWGPRYLLAITPFVIIPIAGLFDSDAWRKTKILKVGVWFIFALSLIIQLAAVSIFFQKYFVKLRDEEKVVFTVAYAEGVQPVVEPPLEIYFDWRRAPILQQFKFIYRIIVNHDAKYSARALAVNPEIIEAQIKADPKSDIFDFWWVYQYVLWRNYFGFIVAVILLFSAIYASIRISQAVQRAP